MGVVQSEQAGFFFMMNSTLNGSIHVCQIVAEPDKFYPPVCKPGMAKERVAEMIVQQSKN